jgi:hypothetical protein
VVCRVSDYFIAEAQRGERSAERREKGREGERGEKVRGLQRLRLFYRRGAERREKRRGEREVLGIHSILIFRGQKE